MSTDSVTELGAMRFILHYKDIEVTIMLIMIWPGDECVILTADIFVGVMFSLFALSIVSFVSFRILHAVCKKKSELAMHM